MTEETAKLDLMIDIESMGVQGNAAVIAIGAVAFNPRRAIVEDIGFYGNIDLENVMTLGGTVDASTIIWWLKQNKNAQNRLFIPDPQPLAAVLLSLSSYYHNCDKVWAHANFDLPILTAAYKSCFLEIPWKHRRARDIRTAIDNAYNDNWDAFQEDMKAYPENSLKHDAAEDARHQAWQIICCYKKMGKCIEI